MRSKQTLIHNFISVLTALFLLPLLITGNGIKTQHGSSLGKNSPPFSISVSDNIALPVIASAEEVLPAKPVRLSHSGAQKLPVRPEWFICFFGGAIRLLAAVLLLYAISAIVSGNIISSRRYIIKYIHDQDGHKDTDLRFTDMAYKAGTLSRRLKYDQDNTYCSMRSDTCRNAVSGLCYLKKR